MKIYTLVDKQITDVEMKSAGKMNVDIHLKEFLIIDIVLGRRSWLEPISRAIPHEAIPIEN
jgi:hypothetical protein